MNAYELYDAVTDAADSDHLSAQDFSDYASGAFDIEISTETADKIAAAHAAHLASCEKDGQVQDSLFHNVQAVLQDIEL